MSCGSYDGLGDPNIVLIIGAIIDAKRIDISLMLEKVDGPTLGIFVMHQFVERKSL